jgi:hypothetical protein
MESSARTLYLYKAIGLRASNKMMLKVDLRATACLQAVIFRQFLLHCLQAGRQPKVGRGTHHFVRSANLMERCLCLLKDFLQRKGGGIADSGIFIP